MNVQVQWRRMGPSNMQWQTVKNAKARDKGEEQPVNALSSAEGGFLEKSRAITHASPSTALYSLVQALYKCLIVSVGRHVGGNAPTDGQAQKIEVSDQVQYLVAHEFVGIPEFGVDDLAVVHNNVRMKIPASDLPELLGHFDILEGVEGAGRCYLLFKGADCRIE